MKKYLTVVFLLIYNCLSAQNTFWNPVLITGFNATSLRADSIDDQTAFLPFLGFGIEKPFDEKTSFGASGSYALKGGNVLSPFSKYRFQYIDFQASASYRLSDIFRFEAGLQPSFVLSSKYFIGTDSLAELNVKKWSSEFSAFAGLHFHFQENVSLGLRYFLPIENSRFNQFQVVLSIPVGGTMEKIENKNSVNLAYQHILALKEGVLLVRLKTSDNIIQHLNNAGKTEEAEKIRQQQRIENLEIVASFKKYFRFCPVYFFYSTQTAEAMSGNFKGILLNDSLQADSMINFLPQIYYFAEFGYLDLNEEGSTGTGIEALIIKDKAFNQLERPFPFYVRRNEFLAGSKNISQVVGMLNFNLEQFYKTALDEVKK
ncbi:MAG TPA: hypothetical protein P5050_08850 [Bacteroidia bacterium]|nr:hypothetical protein [Bacteroidia bacterium]HRS59314.1 hypothetical protein [Bacteroidia bacterium]HRU68254.1 hypothetical protein [Bacteroidia bacterium]